MVNYKYCPRCGGALKNEQEYFECEKCRKRVYLNSAPAASIFVVKKDKVLIGRRSLEPRKRKFDSIGGFLSNGEDPKKGALRETEEEAGLKTRITDFLGHYTDDYEYQGEVVKVLNIVYVGEIVGGKMEPKDDMGTLEWIPINNPPPKSEIAFSWLLPALKDLQKWYKKYKNKA